jgi:hypothetical protein
MSVVAQKWAWEQNLPDRPKFVLVTLADQADSRTGHVCYQRTDAAFFVEKTGISERSFYRCIAALVRQGYLLRDSGRGRDAEYWLCLNREPSELDAWSWGLSGNHEESQAIAEETQDVDGSASVADQESAPEVCQIVHGSPPLLADQDSIDRPKIPAAANGKEKSGFSSQAQALDRVKTQQNESKVVGKVFVIEGTRAWQAWCDHRRSQGKPVNFSYRGEGEYAGKTGRHFESLFPPKSQGDSGPA